MWGGAGGWGWAGLGARFLMSSFLVYGLWFLFLISVFSFLVPGSGF